VLPVVDVAADAHAPQVVMPETQRYLPFRVPDVPFAAIAIVGVIDVVGMLAHMVPVDLYKIHDACS
jgi:hypothetical protein